MGKQLLFIESIASVVVRVNAYVVGPWDCKGIEEGNA